MSVPGVGVGGPSAPSAGNANNPSGFVQRVVLPIFNHISASFRQAFHYNLKAIPVYVVLAVANPTYGIALTFTAIYLGTLAAFTVTVSIYNFYKGNSQPMGNSNQGVPAGAATKPKVSKSKKPKTPVLDAQGSLLSDPAAFVANPKMYQQLSPKPIPAFTPLSKGALQTLLNVEPSLKKHPVAINMMYADQRIMDIHDKGIPDRIFDTTSNNELRDQMRYIIYQISQETDLKKKQTKLRDLAVALEDCAPVTQGNVSKIYQEYTSHGAFEMQLDLFIALAKERALDEVIYDFYPKMRSPTYAAGVMPWKQFPHVKNGFLSFYGSSIGLNIKGASSDPNRNETWAQRKQAEFLDKFEEKFEINKVIKDFVIAINTENNMLIRNEDFMAWCGANGLGDQSMYDEDTADTYPKYFSKPTDAQESMTSAYIKEDVAIAVFKKLKYIA